MEQSGPSTSQEYTNDEYCETDPVEEGNTSQSYESTQKSPKRKRRNPKLKSRQSSVSTVLEGLEDDILEDDHIESVENDATSSSAIGNNFSERVFVQKRKGFEPSSRDRVYEELFLDITQTQELTAKKDLSPHEFAMYLYHKTRLFFSFCHGILGGIGITHMSLVFYISDSPEAVKSFAEGFPGFARIVQILYYILSAICFVSVLDRCDFAGLRLAQCVDFLKNRLADVLTIIFYFGLLVTCVICVRWDDRLALSSENEDLWQDPKVYLSEFTQWRTLSLLRGFFAVAGYIAMFFGPGDDLLFIHLYNIFKQEQQQSNSHTTRY